MAFLKTRLRVALSFAIAVFTAMIPLAAAVAAPSPDTHGVPAALATPSRWPAARSPTAITDAATEAAITRLLARMTVAEKVGQVIQADIEFIRPADLAQYPLGSILAGGNSGPYGNERADAATWQRLVGEFRAASRRGGAGIPILFGVDAVHGHSNLPGATVFPHNIGLGAARDTNLMRRIGEITAVELAASGIEWTFAPTVAVPQDLRWGRSYEGYAADPALVAGYARAMTLGLQGKLRRGHPLPANRVAGTAKHFIADGGTVDGRDQGDARIDEAELIATHAGGYRTAIEAGVLTVMASFSSWNGTKHHGNHSLLTDVLKGRLGFAGLVVGDWNGHGQVPGCTVTHCPAAFNAGIDLFMAPESWRALFHATVDDVNAGRISPARLDAAVRRILRVKFKLGLMQGARESVGTSAVIGSPEHLAVAREAVAKSLVLLKNEASTLPIRPGARVLVAGPGADDMAMQSGGWTITWQGTDTTAADFPRGQTVGRAIAKAVRAAGGEAVVSPTGEMDGRPDIAIVITGEKPYAEYQGDLPHLAFVPRHGEEVLIERLRAAGVKVVVVFLSGRPLFTTRLLNRSDAFVAAWLPGPQGEGVADVLVADREGGVRREFTGRLPFAWPADARSPVNRALFEPGYGLDYRQSVSLPSFPEAWGLEVGNDPTATTFFRLGEVPAPWYLAADGVIASRSVDLSAQADARQFTWSGPGKISVEGAPIDLAGAAAAGAELVLDWRIDRATAAPSRIILGGGVLDFSSAIGNAPRGVVTETRIPLHCFAAAGADLRTVGGALRLEADEGLVVTLRGARVDAGRAGTVCPATAP